MCHRKCVLFKEHTYSDVAISIFSSTSQTSWFRSSDNSLCPPISSSAHTAVVDNMPSKTTHLIFACAHSCDWARSTENDKCKYCIPLSTIQPEWKAKSGDKQIGLVSFYAACPSYLAILAGTDICCIILSISSIHWCRLPHPCWSGECEVVPSFANWTNRGAKGWA